MIIGVTKEIKNHEYRVGLTPVCVKAFVSQGHQVLIEKGAGEGAAFEDSEYVAAGAKIIPDAADVWSKAQMIIKVKEPIESEYHFLRKDMILYTYLHLAADKPLTDALLKAGTKAIAYETIVGKDGSLPCLTPMSQIAGRMSIQEGAKYLEKPFGGRGVLLAGVPGVPKANVVILGGGVVGINACKMAFGMGAKVTILDTNLARLSYIDDVFGGQVTTLFSSRGNLEECLKEADLVIGAVLLPGCAAPKLVKREDLKLMKKGSVLVDVAVDQGGCFETTHATTHQDPIFEIDGIVHYCVANIPGAVSRTSTIALVNSTLDYGLAIAGKGLIKALQDDAGLAKGLNCYDCKIIFSGVADAFHMLYTPVKEICG